MPAKNEPRKPKIFIGVPCYSKVDPEILEDFMRFAYHCGRRMPGYDFVLGIKTKSEQFRARNAIVDGAQQSGFGPDDWMLMIDDDMVINAQVTSGPTDDYGFVEKLISHNKDICGVLYYQRGGNCSPVLMTKLGDKGYRFLRDDEVTGGLQRVDVAGGGCLLIKMGIFDKLKYPYFAPEFEWGTDIQLCRQAAEKGFEVWADTSIEFGHLKNEKAIVTSRNKVQHQMSDTIPGEAKKTFVMSEVYDRLVRDACEYTGRPNIEAMAHEANAFLDLRKESDLPDDAWYRQFPTERISRQVWFNTTAHKQQMTSFVLSSIDHHRQLDILDFGCGIGIPAFALAEKGHRVDALDIKGTGTLEFLKWRTSKYHVPMKILESAGGPPELNGQKYDVIIAMDSLEHIQDWKEALHQLAMHLKPTGVLFANNAILEDNLHPEHYDVDGKEFIRECIQNDLMPLNQITYYKKERENAEISNSFA